MDHGLGATSYEVSPDLSPESAVQDTSRGFRELGIPSWGRCDEDHGAKLVVFEVSGPAFKNR